MGGTDIVAIIGVDIFMYLFGCATCLFVARLNCSWLKSWQFSRKDAVAIMVKRKHLVTAKGGMVIKRLFVFAVLWCHQDSVHGYSSHQRLVFQ